MPASQIVVKAIKFTQGNPDIVATRPAAKDGYFATIYLTALRLEDISTISTIDRAPDGYQRPPDRSRWTKKGTGLNEYILKQESILPTSVLLNARNPEELEFTKENHYDGCEYGTLKIKRDTQLQIIDGQHRVFGLEELRTSPSPDDKLDEKLKQLKKRKDELGDFVLPVSILVLPPANPRSDIIFEEMRQFYIVNKRAKPVPTEVAFENLARMYDLFGLETLSEIEGMMAARQGKAMGIARIVAEKQPWKDKIEFVDTRPAGFSVKAQSFADSIAKGILKETAFDMMEERALAGLITEFWSALEELYKLAFERPEDYHIMGYMGIHTLNSIFPVVYELARTRSNIMNKGAMKAVLQPLAATVKVERWSHRHGSPLLTAIQLGIARENTLKFKDILLGKKKQFP